MERWGQDFMEIANQSFQGTLDAALRVQQHTQKLMEELIPQASVAQDEGRRLFAKWAEQSKKHTEELQKTASAGYQKWAEEVATRLSPLTPATKQETE
jgi:polyhydroxyalkanoate synthesis regulator phasin